MSSASGNTNRVCHFKLVLLGDTAVGKSCLVVRFVRDEYFEYQEPTIGGETCALFHGTLFFGVGDASALQKFSQMQYSSLL
jgi:Ras-related protein Rab-5C